VDKIVDKGTDRTNRIGAIYSLVDPASINAVAFQTTMAFPAVADRARIVFDCRMANDAAMI